MMPGPVHYEAAFADFLRRRGVSFVPLRDLRAELPQDLGVKGFDFLVHASDGGGWIVDVKGRKFPYRTKHGLRWWENWVTCDDLTGLSQWQEAFGAGFVALLVFAYWAAGESARERLEETFEFAERTYGFVAISADDYAAHCRPRSPKWQTVAMPVKTFRELARPMGQWCDGRNAPEHASE